MATAVVVACLSIFLKTGRETPAPLETFLLYPNYRGMMFSDESQVARIAIEVNPPRGTFAQLHVVLEVMDPGGKVPSDADRLSPPAGGSTVATIDMGSLPPGQYRLQGYLGARRQTNLYARIHHDRKARGRDARVDEGVDRFGQYYSHGRTPAVCDRHLRYDRLWPAPRSYAPRLKAIAKAPINLIINYFLSNGRAEVIFLTPRRWSRWAFFTWRA